MLGHASTPEMACRYRGVPPRSNPLAYTRGVLARWEHGAPLSQALERDIEHRDHEDSDRAGGDHPREHRLERKPPNAASG
jgi:hypothetical protein